MTVQGARLLQFAPFISAVGFYAEGTNSGKSKARVIVYGRKGLNRKMNAAVVL